LMVAVENITYADGVAAWLVRPTTRRRMRTASRASCCGIGSRRSRSATGTSS
jgi:hypothetical protein